MRRVLLKHTSCSLSWKGERPLGRAISERVYYLVKKAMTKQGFRVIYINVELLHYFLI